MNKIYLIVSICLFSVIFVSCGDDEINKTDLEDSISWSSISPNAMNWFDAAEYCKNLRERGQSDWHLPTIEELETVTNSWLCDTEMNDIGGESRLIKCDCEYKANKDIYYERLGDVLLWATDELPRWVDKMLFGNNLAWTFFFNEKEVSASYEYDKSYDFPHVRCVRSKKCKEGYVWYNGKCEIPPTQAADCTGLPENAEWNTVSSITQTWNGSDWIPTNLEGTYSEEPSTTECRFKCNSESVWNGEICEKTYTDLITDLMWSPRSLDSMDWYYAMDYCDNLSLFGYNDWHLPTISELRTLILNCPGTETGGECRVTDTCLLFEECFNDACGGCDEADYLGKYSKLDDWRPLWSSTPQSDDADFAWVVYFRDARMRGSDKSWDYFVRCVRSE